MKKAVPFIALLMTFIIVFSVITPAFADEEAAVATAAEESSVSQVASETQTDDWTYSKNPVTNYVYHNGIPTLTTSNFTRIFYALRTIKYLLSGKIAYADPDATLDVEMDDNLTKVCEEIADNSALDPGMLLTNLPDVFEPAALIDKACNIDITAFRARMYEMRDKYSEEGNSFKAGVCWMVGVYLSQVTKATLELEPKKDGNYQVKLTLTFADGETEVMYPDIYVNMETGECYGRDDAGMLRIGFDSNFRTLLVTAPIKCWMKKFGFCFEYDLLCYILPIYCYNTRRFKFDYNNMEYMIQIWKGNYLITNGGEVGIYNRKPGSVGSYYDVVGEDDQLVMSLDIYHENDHLVSIPAQSHWWVNGFKIGNRMYSPHSLRMYFTIQMKDEAMLKAFTAAVSSEYHKDVTYTVDGLTVSLAWLD